MEKFYLAEIDIGGIQGRGDCMLAARGVEVQKPDSSPATVMVGCLLCDGCDLGTSLKGVLGYQFQTQSALPKELPASVRVIVQEVADRIPCQGSEGSDPAITA
jgi:hypothetical protein